MKHKICWALGTVLILTPIERVFALSESMSSDRHNLLWEKLHLREIRGKVISEEGKVLRGASITIKGTKKTTKTDVNGLFSIANEDSNVILIISYVGYKTLEIAISSPRQELLITMEQTNKVLGDVVVTGMFERKKESFTGTTNTVTGDQLRAVGNQNVIQMLRSLDPSFIVVDNNLSGSDPNTLARIELRGKTSITKTENSGVLTDRLSVDPNLPLFILDGFESSLRQITDLDINRIASVTILKDAASTALYGARSANGVIIVETIRPKPGQLQVSYTGDFRLEVADLRDYNLMNATEKLEFERLAGLYTPNKLNPFALGEDFRALERTYNWRLKAVKEGVDTYWLNEPLRNIGLTQNHSVYASGGNDGFQYGIGMNMQQIGGLMKGSDRKNWGARADLTYRNGKLNVTNRIFISGSRADESPYGSFRTYAQLSPYYKSGIKGRYLDRMPQGPFDEYGIDVPNPLFDALLNSEKYSTGLTLQNNLGFNFDLNRSIRFSGAFQLAKSINTAINFISPLHTQFEYTNVLEKGRYTNQRSEGLNYSGNIGTSYNKVIQQKHVLTGNLRTEIQENNNSSIGFTAVGFPTGVKGNPSFAYSYQPNSKPFASTPPKTRRINGLISINYAYDNRYFMDATYRIDGSTAFGTANKFSPFWATGLGWSLHNEGFLKKLTWIRSLILRANVGSSGNQNFGSFASTTVYNLQNSNNYFGQSLYHSNLGNPNLNWQKTIQTSTSLDMGLFENRLTVRLNAYHKKTDPLIITIDIPGSNGISNYPMNAGNMIIKGTEADIKYSPIFNLNKRVIWTLGINGSMYQSKYANFGSVLKSLNEEQQRSKSIQRFTDGTSPDDLWSLVSMGIDPGTGREVFLKNDGSYTFDYDLDDIKIVGNTRPKIEGIFNSSLRIKGFTFNTYIRYSVGASRLNNALYEKVENIGLSNIASNQDKRALELRWKTSGDISQFKGISLTEATPISSRFIQKENFISGESISVGYDFQATTSHWLRATRIQNLRISGFMNNIFRLSNILSERGIDYPFANTISFSLNASF